MLGRYKTPLIAIDNIIPIIPTIFLLSFPFTTYFSNKNNIGKSTKK